jgi:hypothetical protein
MRSSDFGPLVKISTPKILEAGSIQLSLTPPKTLAKECGTSVLPTAEECREQIAGWLAFFAHEVVFIFLYV